MRDIEALKAAVMQTALDCVLADASKLSRASQQHWVSLPPRWTLITDAAADEEQCSAFAAEGARIILAQAD